MWTEADRDRVQEALASGERSVTFADGRKLEYQTTGEMMKLLDKINGSLTASDSSRHLRRATVARVGQRR